MGITSNTRRPKIPTPKFMLYICIYIITNTRNTKTGTEVVPESVSSHKQPVNLVNVKTSTNRIIRNHCCKEATFPYTK